MIKDRVVVTVCAPVYFPQGGFIFQSVCRHIPSHCYKKNELFTVLSKKKANYCDNIPMEGRVWELAFTVELK